MSENNIEIITLNKPGITDFAKERNTLLSKSKSEWVFFVDSDETLSKDFHKEILKQVLNDNYNGYYVKRKNYFLGKYIGEDKIIRLGRKNAGKWQRAVHEIWNIKGKVGTLKNPIIHNTAKDLHEYITKIDYYSTLHARENLESGKRSNIFKIVFFPIFKFIQSMTIGRGFVMSMLQSFHSFLSWSKAWKLQNT